MTFHVHNVTTRGIARRALVAAGRARHQVHGMTYDALNAALAADARAMQFAETEAASVPAPVPPVPAPAPAPGPRPAVVLPDPSPPVSGGLDAILTGIARDAATRAVDEKLAGFKGDLDAEAVRRIAEEAIADQRAIRIEVKDGDVVRDVPGITHAAFERVVRACKAKLHVWLPGPAGSGKSTLGRQVGLALGYREEREGDAYDTPGLIHLEGAIPTVFKLVGYIPVNPEAKGAMVALYTAFRRAWQFGGLFLWDDVDRSDAKAFAMMNEALANGYCSFPDGTIRKHDNFRLIATANTYGLGGGADYVGASRLDKATLDRFYSIEIPYDEKAERAIAAAMSPKHGAEWSAHVQRVRAACARLGNKHLVTPRATYKGIIALEAGESDADVARSCLYAGLDDAAIARVKGAL